ncbi:uncharacterized protein EHS24_002887 [Apiotrichum porosum]|uniref:Uncharacterized protein n=1 Tax=Apiotrichum porosum TaxID=105984 RepID=A0A427XGD5_9TREE|nr:uncharacterized protein EHS24_002887 [Apiotrichum porosum]RSH77827.1 hypothetical protein EHS24_002887 [Apiotrichum porosum]
MTTAVAGSQAETTLLAPSLPRSHRAITRPFYGYDSTVESGSGNLYDDYEEGEGDEGEYDDDLAGDDDSEYDYGE